MNTQIKSRKPAHRLIDTVIAELDLRNDTAFGKRFGMDCARVCNIRSGRTPVSSNLILAIHETAGIPVSRIRELLA